MSRYVAVRYLTPVFAIVDLDAEPIGEGDDRHYPDDAVVRVQHGDSEVQRLDHPDGIKYLTEGDVLAESYLYGDENVSPDSLTPEEREKALDVAENTIWPAWEGY